MTTTTAAEATRARARHIEETWPLLTYHYGLTVSEIRRTPNILLEVYIRALGPILAREQQKRIEAASFAYMDEAGQTDVRDALKEALESGRPVDERPQGTRGVNPLAAVVAMGIDVDIPADDLEPDPTTRPEPGRWPGAIGGDE